MKKLFLIFTILFFSGGFALAEEAVTTNAPPAQPQTTPLKALTSHDTIDVTAEKISDAADKDAASSSNTPLFEIYVEEVQTPEELETTEKQETNTEGTPLDSIGLDSPSKSKKYAIKTTKNKLENLKIPENVHNQPQLTVSYPSIGQYYALNNTIYKSKHFKNVSFGTNIKSEMAVNSDSTSSDVYTQFKYGRNEFAGQLGNSKEINHFGTTTSTNIFAISHKFHITDNISFKTKYSQSMEQQSWFKNEFGIVYKPKVKNYSIELNTSFGNEDGTEDLSKKFSVLMNYEF